jgi:hypothetical protein
LIDINGNITKVLVNVNSLEVKSDNEIIVKYGFNQWAGITVDKVAQTQVEPNAAAPFSGDVNDLITLLSTDFFFEISGGGGSQNLASVLANGNSSGNNDILFFAFQGLQFGNGSRLKEGTVDAGLGGFKGIAEICGLGYESKWEGGVRYIMGSSGNTIRQSLYNFGNIPTINDDFSKGYQIGSLWTLDNGDTYICADNTTSAAVWVLNTPNSDGWTYIIKNTTQDVTNSATLTDDSDLKFSVKAGKHYMLEMDIVISANDTNGDYKNAFSVGFGTMKGVGISIANGTGSNAQLHNMDAYIATTTTDVKIGTAHSDLDYLHSIKIIFSFTPNANTVFKYQFANNNAGVGRISRTWKGSVLKYKEIG